MGQVTDERGAWRTYGEKTLYDSRWVRLGLVDVEAPNGERWDYHVVHFGRIAIAMIVDEDDDTVLMLWRYRQRRGCAASLLPDHSSIPLTTTTVMRHCRAARSGGRGVVAGGRS